MIYEYEKEKVGKTPIKIMINGFQSLVHVPVKYKWAVIAVRRHTKVWLEIWIPYIDNVHKREMHC